MRDRGLFVVALLAVLAGVAAWLLWPAPLAPEVTEAHDPSAQAPGAGQGALAAKPAASKVAAATPRRKPVPVPAGPVLSGRVVDGAGRGIAGARVLAIPDTTGTTPLPDEVAAEGGVGAENFTGDDGRFVVAAVGEAPLYSLVAEADGYAPSSVADLRPGSDATIVLRAGTTLLGRVLTLEGDPVAGAKVRACGMADVVRVERESVSAPDGSFRIERLSMGGGMWDLGLHYRCVLVECEGFAPLYVSGWGREVPGRPDERSIDLVLVRGATLSGRVIDDESGTGVEAARVVLWSIESMSSTSRPSGASVSNPWSPRPLAETRSGPDGAFSFAHVPANGYHRVMTNNSGRRGRTLGHVGAWKEGYTWASDEVPVPSDSAILTSEIRLRPSASLLGRVLASDGMPAAKAYVGAMLEAGGPGGAWVPAFLREQVGRAFATTDDNGRYRIPAAPASARTPSRVKVTAYEPLSGVSRGRQGAQASTTVDVRAGEETSVPDIRLGAAPAGPATEILLVVADSSGAPVWGARPEAASFDGGFPMSGRTDRDGRLRLPVPPVRRGGLQPAFVVRAKGYAPAPLPWPASPAPGQEVRVVLEAAHRVSGRVANADGTPAAGASVSVFRGAVALADLLPRPTAPGEVPMPALPRDPSLAALAWASAGPDGAFAVGDLPEGPYHVLAYPSVWPAGAPPAPATASGVGSDAQDVALTLPPAPPSAAGRLLVGVVDATTRRPVGLAEVTATRRRGPDEAPAGPRFVDLGDGRFAMQPGAMDPAAERLSPGQFEVRNAPPGVYDLDVRAKGYAPARVEGVTVGGGDVQVPTIALSRGARLHGALRLPEGVSAGDRSLQFTPDGGTPRRSGATADVLPDGSYAVSGLLPGAYRVRFDPTGLAFADGGPQSSYLREGDAPVVIPEGASDVETDLVLVEAGRLRVEVYDPRLPPSPFVAGPPVTLAQAAFGRGCTVVVTTKEGREVARADSLENGYPMNLTYMPVLPGSYVVTYTPRGGPPQTATADVTAGKESAATIGTPPARR